MTNIFVTCKGVATAFIELKGDMPVLTDTIINGIVRQFPHYKDCVFSLEAPSDIFLRIAPYLQSAFYWTSTLPPIYFMAKGAISYIRGDMPGAVQNTRFAFTLSMVTMSFVSFTSIK